MISAFGPAATAYAHRLGNVEAIVCDFEYIGMAYREAVRRRELGDSFYGLVLVDDPRVTFAYRYAEAIVSQVEDYDRRIMVVRQLALGALNINGKRADEIWPFDPGFEHVSVEFLWLCDALLVRSWAEHARINAWFARDPVLRPMRSVERILATASVPAVERVRPDRPGVVIWAPARPALETALALHGLEEYHGELTCVTAGGPVPSRSAAAFFTPDDPGVAAALARASAVICIDPGDPSDAVAFARQGYGVVAPITSGAHEWADNVLFWDPLDPQRLFTATAIAIARPAGVRAEPSRPPQAPRSVPALPAFVDPQALPLVSIITPTFNRRDDLRKMLSCIAAQTYPNIESVVVNDGGIAIDDIVAEFPFARLIDKEQNAGTARAQLTGWEHARGTYIGLLPDDDWLMPDHIERMMHALLRSGAKVAHGAGLLRYLERLEDGAWVTVGFNATTFCQTLAASDALVSSTIGGHQALLHRSVYEDVGWYLLDNNVSDNEIHARITKTYMYAFVDHVTSEFRDHASGQGRYVDFTSAMREVYEIYHPVPNRPIIEQIRASTLGYVAKREPGKPPFPPTLMIHR